MRRIGRIVETHESLNQDLTLTGSRPEPLENLVLIAVRIALNFLDGASQSRLRFRQQIERPLELGTFDLRFILNLLNEGNGIGQGLEATRQVFVEIQIRRRWTGRDDSSTGSNLGFVSPG